MRFWSGRELIPVGLAATLLAGVSFPALEWTGGSLVPLAMANDDDDENRDSDSDAGDSDSDIAVPIEFIVAAPLPSDIDNLAAAGFEVLARDRVAIIDAEIARVSPPAGLDLAAARATAADIAPDAILDENNLYRPDEMPCGEGGCAAFELASWPQPAAYCALAPSIGLLDTGVNAQHAALAGASIELLTIVAADREPGAKSHGTAVAALLAGDPQSRSPGLLPRAHLVAVEAFHRRPDGTDAADAFDLARGLGRLAEAGVPVANLSFSGPDNAVFRRVVESALLEGMTIVAAVGNAGPGAEPLYPAAYEGVVAVTAIDRQKRIYRQAVQGEHVDFAAPGVRLWTAASVSGGRFRSGTSYAAPFVTAALAVAGHRGEGNRDTLVATLAGGAIDLGEPGRDPVFGWGMPAAPDCRAGETLGN